MTYEQQGGFVNSSREISGLAQPEGLGNKCGIDREGQTTGPALQAGPGKLLGLWPDFTGQIFGGQ